MKRYLTDARMDAQIVYHNTLPLFVIIKMSDLHIIFMLGGRLLNKNF